MGRQVPVRFEDRNKRAKDRERRLAELRVRLQETADEIRTARGWTRCLRTAAQFPGESWANILLISSRIPDATLVKGYEAWRALGRQVRRDEKGIEIFSAPRRRKGNDDRRDGEQTHSWRDAQRVTYVWDLSQTTGQPLPALTAIPSRSGELPPGLWECLCWLARREGFAVEREPGCPADGTMSWAARRIRILPDLAIDQAVWALAHQLGHVLLHNTGAALPGSTTSGCQGVRKAEADSVAFITCARYGVRLEHAFSSPQSWAGSDPRAQPGAVILAVGERITTAAAEISGYLDRHLAGSTAGQVTRAQPEPAALTAPLPAAAPPPEPDAGIEAVLLDAEAFYTGQLASSWAPGYLHQRGITAAVAGEWHIGYAPPGWTALTTYLRGRGHPDKEIQAAGLARVCSRGTLIDHFRDRVMLPVHDEYGKLAGFIGRARPGAGPDVPKYLNSPATSTYKKGDLLFGLSQVRAHLARGAVPVIVEGPFDAIAVSSADPGHYVGLAPCGTALTNRQAAALAHTADLRQTGGLVAFDDDTAGRKAAIRAYHILRGFSDLLQSVRLLPGKDPADILETVGAPALRAILRDRTQPLSAVVIDAHIDPWERRLRDPEGPLLAMRSLATVIASLLPPEAVQAIRRITGDKELIVLDEQMRPVTNPELPELARALPADSAYQIARTAERLGFTDYSDVLAEVANAVTRKAARPKAVRPNVAPRLSDASFPHKPPVTQRRDEPQLYGSSRQAPARTRRGRSTYYLPERSHHLGQGLPSVITPSIQCKTVRAPCRIFALCWVAWGSGSLRADHLLGRGISPRPEGCRSFMRVPCGGGCRPRRGAAQPRAAWRRLCLPAS
jgi:DNA primase